VLRAAQAYEQVAGWGAQRPARAAVSGG
jgi:hypothetical protein